MAFLKRYWVALTVLIGACGYFLSMAAPDITWVNVDFDSIHYLSGSQNFVVTPSQGAPFYNIINTLIVRIPIGEPFWRICASSAIFSGFTAMFLFLMAKRYTKSNLIALLAPLCFCASAIVVSQATILKQYSLLTMLSALSIYLHFTGRDKAKYIVLMIGVGVHHLIALPLVVIFLFDMVKHKKEKTTLITKKMLIPIAGLLFYLWVPLCNRFPYTLTGGTSLDDYKEYFTRNSGLIGGLAIFTKNGIQRLQDIISMWGYSFGAGWILIAYALWRFRRNKKDIETGILVFLWAIPLIYSATNEDPTVFTYTMMSFAFGGLLVVKGAEGLRNVKYKRFQYGIPIVTGICCIGMIIANTFYFDIGRNSDVEFAEKQYYESLADIPDNSCIWAGFLSPTYVAIQYENDNLYRGITIVPLKDSSKTVSSNLELAEQAWANDSLYIIDYSVSSDGFIKATNRKVTNESFAEDIKYIRITCNLLLPSIKGFVQEYGNWSYYQSVEDKEEYIQELIDAQTPTSGTEFYPVITPVSTSAVQTGWSNPIDLIRGKECYSKWKITINSNLSAGYVFMWAVVGYFTPSLTRTLFGKKVKDKKKLNMITFIMLLLLMAMMATVLMNTGTPMFWQKGV